MKKDLIQVLSSCEQCIHQNLCMYKEDIKECIIQINGKLDNIAYNKPIFNWTLKCKGYINKEIRRTTL